MSGTLRIIAGARVYVRPPEAPPLTSERDAGDLIGETYGLEADWSSRRSRSSPRISSG